MLEKEFIQMVKIGLIRRPAEELRRPMGYVSIIRLDRVVSHVVTGYCLVVGISPEGVQTSNRDHSMKLPTQPCVVRRQGISHHAL